MTKHPAKPSQNETGQRFEVTPAMVRAAFDVIWSYYPETIDGDSSDRLMVEEMFRAMLDAESQESPHIGD